MATPLRPGWYPAPDGSGAEQWWNGASWSDAQRGAGGVTLPGLPAYRATPPTGTPGTETPPPLPPTQPPTFGTQAVASRPVSVTSSMPTLGVILGVLGIIFFAPLGIVAIVLGAMALRRPDTVAAQRTIAIAAIVTGIIAVVWAALQLGALIFSFASGTG